MMRTLVVCTWIAVGCIATSGQDLPDIPGLLQVVKEHQQQVVANLKNYTFHKSETAEYGTAGWFREFDVSYVNGHQIDRMVNVNGQPLDARRQKKVDNEVAKEVDKARKTPAKEPSAKDNIAIENVLANMTYSNPRRDVWQSRPTILLDYTCTGAPESAGEVAHIYGEIWIDETDKQVAKLEARLQEGKAGPKASDPVFTFGQEKIADGSWLPVSMTQSGAQHMLGMGVGATSRRTLNSDYKRTTGVATR